MPAAARSIVAGPSCRCRHPVRAALNHGDGAIHETAYYQPIRDGCQIFFIPKLEGVSVLTYSKES